MATTYLRGRSIDILMIICYNIRRIWVWETKSTIICLPLLNTLNTINFMNLFNNSHIGNKVSNNTDGQSVSYSQMSLAKAKSQRSQRKLKALFALASVTFISLVFSLNLLSSSAASKTANTDKPNTNSATQLLAKLTNASSDKSGNKATGTAISSTNTSLDAVKNCTPARSYQKPSNPTVDSRSNQVISAATITTSYQVYGNSSEQINNQIFSCTPVLSNGKRFAASTDYSISWSIAYRTISGNPGMCKVSSAGVGLNQSMVFPSWKASSNAPSKTKQQWKSFISNLEDHEQEHAEINRQYANRILSELRNLPATNCGNISHVANSRANGLVKSMDKANRDLDSHTHHGATTGASL